MYCRKCGIECFTTTGLCEACNKEALAATAEEEEATLAATTAEEEAALAAKKKSIRNFCIGAACVFVALLLIAVAVLLIMVQRDDDHDGDAPNGFGGLLDAANTTSNLITVDNFVGMAYDEISNHPNFSHYTIVTPQTAYNADYPEGYVYKQDPEVGSTIKTKSELTLYVSLGPRLAEVPTMTPGETEGQVRGRLLAAGFTVNVVEESSMEYKQGTVIRLSPEPGSNAQYGSEIIMYVSSGEPAAEPIDIPNVLGMSVDDAIDRLAAAGFDRNKVTTTAVNSPATKDTVLSITPDHSQQRLPDTSFQIVISSGFQDVEISLELPDTTNPISLAFYIAGIKDDALSAQYTSILPKDIGTITFTAGLTKESYTITVLITDSNEATYQEYAIFEVNGRYGTYVQTHAYDFTDVTLGGPEPTEPTATEYE